MSETIQRTKLYEDVTERMLDHIRTETWAPGTKIPPEVELAKLFDGQYAIEKNIDTLVCIGEISKSMYEGALSLRKENVYYFPTQEEFWKKMDNILEDGMTILIKASRGMHFEKTTERIKEIK